jgi:ssDNA-binding Zn-finger/Zn-ribbon topoisomerase 1
MGFRSLLNKLTGGIPCPACGTPGARKKGDRVQCTNPACQNYDPARGGPSIPQPQPPAPVSSVRPANVASGQSGSAPRVSGGKVNIVYQNYKGESKTFVADGSSLKRVHNHIIAKVAPKGRALTLSRACIQNMQEIDAFLPPAHRSGAAQPTARERQVLGYHKKYGTTSPLYEKIKSKYPDW